MHFAVNRSEFSDISKRLKISLLQRGVIWKYLLVFFLLYVENTLLVFARPFGALDFPYSSCKAFAGSKRAASLAGYQMPAITRIAINR